MQVLQSENFEQQLEELKTLPFEIKTLRGFPSLEQTKRNKVRRDLMDSFAIWLEEKIGAIVNVNSTDEGIAIEVENSSVLNKAKDDSSMNGFITIMVDMSIQNLAYDSMEHLRDEEL